ncbi:MAG: hypothetical protein AAGM46_25655 [Cyanobacteria bacterium J06582_2]
MLEILWGSLRGWMFLAFIISRIRSLGIMVDESDETVYRVETRF